MTHSEMLKHTVISQGARCEGEVEHPIRLQPQAELHRGAKLGAFGFLNVGTIVYGGVEIGRYLSCGRGVEIGVVSHPLDCLSTHAFVMNSAWFPTVEGFGVYKHSGPTPIWGKKTVIGNDVWIGAQAIISAGVSIGTGAVVGANSVVTKDVAPYAVVAGSPARFIRWRFDEEVRDKLLASKWWELDFSQITTLSYRNIHEVLAELNAIRNKEVGRME